MVNRSIDIGIHIPTLKAHHSRCSSAYDIEGNPCKIGFSQLLVLRLIFIRVLPKLIKLFQQIIGIRVDLLKYAMMNLAT